MSEEKLHREEFPFPFTPYSIQQDFMSNLYSALEDGKLGIFESPTGTGKSLSVICGALSWLRDHEERERLQLQTAIAELDTIKNDVAGDDWLNQQANQVTTNQKKLILHQKLNAIKVKDEKMEKLRSRKKLTEKVEKQFSTLKQPKGSDDSVQDVDGEVHKTDDDADILLEDIESNGEESEEEEENNEEEEHQGVKIYFCSRTHSQLAQFVGEVQRSTFNEDIRLVSLASRQNYCINSVINKLKNVSLINERCLEMQKGKKGRVTAKDEDGKTRKKSRCSTGCPHLKQRNVERLRDEALITVQDVEQLVAQGQKMDACPYYASRAAVKDAQVVVVPYNTLLHKSTRDACGINLHGNVVIIDEAHNLLDTIGHIHSAEVSGQQLAHSYSQVTQYRDKYHTRFSAANLLYLNQVIFVIGRLVAMLGGKPGCNPMDTCSKGIDTKLHSLSQFVLTAEIDNLNMYKLLAFCKKSKIAQKLQGFSERYQPSVVIRPKPVLVSGIRAFLQEIKPSVNIAAPPVLEQADAPQPISNNPLMAVLSFMECLTNHSEDGRVVCNRMASVGRGSLKYLLLNPAAHFTDVVQQARCVIVAGGTMQPVSEFTDQLFLAAGGDSSRISHFSCGHVIPPENILPITLSTGPSGKPLDFSYQQRNTLVMLNELGRLVVNVCNVVPAGVVCFFPSYDYEAQVYQHLDKSGVIARLQLKKKIFREPKRAGMVDQVLGEYATCIDQSKHSIDSTVNGALLFSVMGGKLSEGLNFSDDLGRCVIVVGLPYPNVKSPELQEKLNYLNTNVDTSAGNKHYENLCMKAVNQSIGRAVRHKGDYAAVLLLDQRYARPRTHAALPSWIQTSLQAHDKFGPAIRTLSKFFAEKSKSSSENSIS